ncbi:MAG: hypothetical protein FD177_2576 [Desulfovibrionaceae bacterium]|nr:MAG: hypothetical protein FD177_2576 [Desulfovibrionaceae bacterium]
MNEAVPYEIRQALGMPHADLATACERIRTMRQTELYAEHLHRTGRLCPPKPDKPLAPPFITQEDALFLSRILAVILAAALLALLLGWTSLAGQPQADTWKHRFQSSAHPQPDVEQLLRAARRERVAFNP